MWPKNLRNSMGERVLPIRLKSFWERYVAYILLEILRVEGGKGSRRNSRLYWYSLFWGHVSLSLMFILKCSLIVIAGYCEFAA